jgi:hypothetical protein
VKSLTLSAAFAVMLSSNAFAEQRELDGFIELLRVRTSGQRLLERARARDHLERLPKWIYDRDVAHLYE